MGAGGSRVVVAGMPLETRWFGPGPGAAPTILMLHDRLDSAASWTGFPEALARASGCGVLAYTRAGYGTSTPVVEASSIDLLEQEATSVLPGVLAAVGFRRGILLAHGEGAAIAIIYAGGVQDHRVRGLALLAPGVFVEEAPGVERSAGRAWDVRDQVGYVRVPILAIRGTRDERSTEAQIQVLEEEAYCPVDVVRLEQAGHALHQDRPEETLAAVTLFVRRLMESHEEAKASSSVEADVAANEPAEGARHGD